MERVIEVKGLAKAFGDFEAVKGLDFYVERGTLFAFLGPNGAGKSTTIDMLTTQTKPDTGEVHINGFRLDKQNDEIRASIGIVFQNSLLDDRLSVEENLKVRGSLYGLKGMELRRAVAQAVEIAGVEEFLGRHYGKLSGGQRRRADIARALIHMPEILFLDEPTTGLDPQTRSHVWQMIHKLQKERGMTIFLTTHYMEEAEEADYVVVIDHGKLLAKGTPLTLKEQYASDLLRLHPLEAALSQVLAHLEKEDIAYTLRSNVVEVQVDQSLDGLIIAQDCQELLKGVELKNGSMDDVFLCLTGREIRG